MSSCPEGWAASPPKDGPPRPPGAASLGGRREGVLTAPESPAQKPRFPCQLLTYFIA